MRLLISVLAALALLALPAQATLSSSPRAYPPDRGVTPAPAPQVVSDPGAPASVTQIVHRSVRSAAVDRRRWIIPGREILLYSPGHRPPVVASAAGTGPGSVIENLPQLGAVVVRTGAHPTRPLAGIATQGAPRVEPDVRLQTQNADCSITPGCVLPNDPAFHAQWYLSNNRTTIAPSGGGMLGADIDAPLGWALQRGSPAVRIAILDTGIDLHHPDLAGRVVANTTLSTNRSDFSDPIGHGTAVAGVAAAIPNDGFGVAGVAYNASVVNVKTFDNSSSYEGESCSAEAAGVVAAVNARAQVINMSSGGPIGCTLLQRAVDLAWSRGSLVVAAAGNSGNSTPMYPAAFRNVVSVAATDAFNRPASFTNRGAGWVDLAAPGVGIVVDAPTYRNRLGPQRFGVADGTSFSAPMVSGAAALLFSMGLNNHQVAARLFAYANRIAGTGSSWRYGLLDVCAAIAAGQPLCPRGVSAAPAAPVAPKGAAPPPAAALATSGRYRGVTSQGQPIELHVLRSQLTGLDFRFSMRCGSRSTPTFAITLVGAGHPLAIASSARFAHVYSDPTGIRYVVRGSFAAGGRASGSLLAQVRNGHYGGCASGAVGWSAHT